MVENLEQVEYRSGLLEAGRKPGDLPVKTWRGAEIPPELRKAIDQEGLLSLGGVHGLKGVGDPVEYDHLKLVLTDEVVEITVFNRGITLSMTDDEELRRIHRVLCRLDREQAEPG